ncbi:hypothetical protein CRM22_010956 [Opisthorchis felineus]|uniref:Uncharacterized protein n=1 Tax=Opisthorchis felineus TaxID=147828 RepID=A0A4S2KLG9_OPIFE|nr:hypothetical protein CRM22_010956 [Opisthorchis felineus]
MHAYWTWWLFVICTFSSPSINAKPFDEYRLSGDEDKHFLTRVDYVDETTDGDFERPEEDNEDDEMTEDYSRDRHEDDDLVEDEEDEELLRKARNTRLRRTHGSSRDYLEEIIRLLRTYGPMIWRAVKYFG